jgi:hypothetical protein
MVSSAPPRLGVIRHHLCVACPYSAHPRLPSPFAQPMLPSLQR